MFNKKNICDNNMKKKIKNMQHKTIKKINTL